MQYRQLSRLSLLAVMVTMPNLAQAGDAAKLDIIGFSKDGGIFAFEEYGIQDGSGFPYTNRFYIDTATDKFLAKTPVRIRLDDENSSVEKARSKAEQDGQNLTSLPDTELRKNAGHTVAFNPVTELFSDPFKVIVNPRPVFPALDTSLTITLQEIPAPASETCNKMGEIKGFRLTLAEDKPDAKPELLHEDQAIPTSRGCPLGYSIGAVQTFYPDNGKPVVAVMISVRDVGFEGPDYRWLAVTKQR
ncbi:putative secreted protein [Phyllobacterium ifriqiyense]|uniref:Secreted protein n=2 Tax=Phyllobacterium ifriqiyense TaxID=314238 RepID=A0ABU0SF59_9HYPH|nr:putative secreted protein [Phyllobacterium ifriqiyense]